MLNKTRLKNELKAAFDDIFPGAFEEAYLATMPTLTKEGKDIAKEFGERVNKLISDDLSTAMASAIDYYVRNISISGTLITQGTPVLHTCRINSPSPLVNGILINSLKIN